MIRLLLIALLLSGCASRLPWIEIADINYRVNHSIEYWDNPVDWQLPIDGKGDCTTYALVKQIKLAKIGVKSKLTVCPSKRHAFLLVDSVIVLDNRTDITRHINETEYRDDYEELE